MSATFGLPMTRRFTENSAIIVRIDASRLRILKRTLSMAVTMPAAAPAAMAISAASQALTPAMISTAVTAAPSGNEPSTVRSGKSTDQTTLGANPAKSAKLRSNWHGCGRKWKICGSSLPSLGGSLLSARLSFRIAPGGSDLRPR